MFRLTHYTSCNEAGQCIEILFDFLQSGDHYTATKSDDSVLPSWLSFTAAMCAFSGTPTAAEAVSLKVTASDGNGGPVSDTFDIAVSAAGNNAPVFDPASVSRSIAENIAAGENVGAAVTATDADSDTLTYSLGGTDMASFNIVASTEQIRTRSGVSYDYEAKTSYTVTATDTGSATADATVTINITDVNEPPSAPAPDFAEWLSYLTTEGSRTRARRRGER